MTAHIKPTMLIVFTLLTLFLQPMTLQAQEPWSFNNIKNDWPGFLLGFVGGLAAHELGHLVIASCKGYDAEFDGISIVYPGVELEDGDHLQLAAAGLQTQWLVSELVFLHHKDKPVMGNGAAGLILSQVGTAAAYLTVLKDHKDGDIEGMSQATGLSNNELALAVAVPALLDTWRLLGKDVPSWVPILSLGSKGLMLVKVWTY